MTDSTDRLLVLSLLLALLPIAACGPERPRDVPRAEMEERVVGALDSLRSSYQEAYNAGDTARIMSLFGSEAVYLPPAGPTLTGRDSIREYLAHELRHSPTLQIESRGTDVVTEAVVVNHGTWQIRVAAESGVKPRTLAGAI